MSIVIDSLRPNDACRSDPSPRDTCEVEASFHTVTTPDSGAPVVQSMWDTDRIIFRRGIFPSSTGASVVRFVIDDRRLPSTIRAILRDHSFDGSDTILQSSLDRSSSLSIFLRDAMVALGTHEPSLVGRYTGLQDDLINYILVGNVASPDSIQQERNRRIYRGILELPPTAHVFLRSMISEGLGVLNRTRWSEEMLVRIDRLTDVFNFSQRLREQLAPLPEDNPLTPQIRTFLVQLMNYLYTGEGSLDEIRRTMRPLALELYRSTPPAEGEESVRDEDRLNLYRIVGLGLEALTDRAPFQRDSDARTRLSTLTRLMQLPTHEQDLRYSILEPEAALERSLLDELQSESGYRSLVERVDLLIRPPNFSATWIREHGSLGNVLHAILSSLRLERVGEEREYRLRLSGESLRTLRSQLDTILLAHAAHRREFAATVLAVFRHLFGNLEATAHIRGFWNGEMRDLTVNLSRENRELLRVNQHWLEGQLGDALVETHVVLPIVEGLTCLAGGGVIAWGALSPSRPGDVNPQYLTGGGLTGLGCASLLTHFIIPTRSQDRLWVDAVGGGVGAILGVAIPLILQFATGGGGMMPPIDGRNPTMGFGP